MKSLFKSLKKKIKDNGKYIIRHHWLQNLNDLHKEKNIAIENLRKIDREIEKTELVIFGN